VSWLGKLRTRHEARMWHKSFKQRSWEFTLAWQRRFGRFKRGAGVAEAEPLQEPLNAWLRERAVLGRLGQRLSADMWLDASYRKCPSCGKAVAGLGTTQCPHCQAALPKVLA
jgi:hypothetical protein